MAKVLSLSFLLSFCALFGETAKNIPDFFVLMGKGTKTWRKVKTKEDKKNLEIFKESFERNYDPFENPGKEFIIPKKVHFVWLGPKEYPERSRGYLKAFIDMHPNWEWFFWTDKEHSEIDTRVKQRIINETYLGEYQDLYLDSDNFGEKSDLLRLVILQKEGGLYVDHDVCPRRAFTALHQNYDFYTGLQNLGNHVMTLSTVVRNSIIGAKADHPIIHFALGLTREKWQAAYMQYPGKDIDATMARVTLRAFGAFHEAVFSSVQDPSFEGIVFPAGFFNEVHHKYGIYSQEDMAGAWYRDEMTFYEKHLQQRVKKLMKRLNLTLGVVAVLFLLNFLLIGYLFYLTHARR